MSQMQLLIVCVDDRLIGVPCEYVRELLHPNNAHETPVPGLKAPFKGVLSQRGPTLPLMDLRALLGLKTFEEQHADLKALLAAREQDHVDWLNDLRECCHSGAEFQKATDPHKCAFGKWYDGLRSSQEALSALTGNDKTLVYLVNQFDAPHKAIHGIAEEALSLAKDGKLEESTALIEEAWNKELGKMRELFAALIQGVEDNRRMMYLVLDIGDEHLACVVDESQSLIRIDSNDIQTVVAGGVAVHGVYPHQSEGNIMILDVEYVARLMQRDETKPLQLADAASA